MALLAVMKPWRLAGRKPVTGYVIAILMRFGQLHKMARRDQIYAALCSCNGKVVIVAALLQCLAPECEGETCNLPAVSL